MNLNTLIAFTAGFLSFCSPCVLPLIPSTLVFLSGITVDDYNEFRTLKFEKAMVLHTLLFVVGFSFVFVALGFSSSLVGRFLTEYQTVLMKIGGALLILMGLFTLNLIRIPLLNRETVVHLKRKPIGLFGSFVVGVTFSLGWTPCIGPALSSILILASTQETAYRGAYLLSIYSLGLAIPFVVSALLFNLLLDFLGRFVHIVKYTVKALGVLLIATGLLLLTAQFHKLGQWLEQLF